VIVASSQLSVQRLEPFGLVHQWGNPGDEPLTFLAFNINPDGVAAVVFETAATHK
jgi:hypothetical protein